MGRISNLEKILDHPEKDKIISMLVGGEPAKAVAQHLKMKYGGSDEGHLRISADALKDFSEVHLSQYKAIAKLVDDENAGRIDKRIADSLLKNNDWKDRLAEQIDGEIDLKKKVLDVLYMVEVRTEQVFDKIQENPAGFKADYVLLKYFEMLFRAIEKADDLINDKPDQLIQHNISIQMVEEHSAVFQETLREVLMEMDPEVSARFMERLTDKMRNMKAPIERPIDSVASRIIQAEEIIPDFDEEIEV